MRFTKSLRHQAAVITVSLFTITFSGCVRSPEAKSARYLEAGKSLLQKHDTERAILQFRNAIQVLPQNAEAYYQLGMAYSAANDYRPAIGAFLKAVEIDPKHAGARLRIARMKADTANEGLLKEAQSELEALSETNSTNPDVLNTLALTEMKLGDPESAVQTLDRALSEFSPELGSFVLLAQAKFEQKDIKGAEETLKKACSEFPKSADAHRILAGFYLAQSRLAEAETELRLALSLNPKDGSALYNLARLQIIEGRKKEAEESFRQLPGFPGYKFVYGVFLFQDGRQDEAVRQLERTFQANPDDRQVRAYLLAAYRKLHRAADIDRVLAAALKKDQKDAQALLQRAEILTERGEYNQAELDLNTVTKFSPNLPEVHYLHSKLYKLRGLSGLYAQELSETLRLNPALLNIRIELAQDLASRGQGKAALDTLDSALQSQKSTVPFLVARNWALWTNGDLAEMRKGINAGLARERNPEFLIQDGLWKYRSGNPGGAQSSLQEALKIDPTNLFALQALNTTYAAQNSTVALQKVKEYASQAPKSAPVQNFLGQLLLANGDQAQARVAFNAAKAAGPQSIDPDLSLIQMDYMEHKYDNARARLQNVLASYPQQQTPRLWLGIIEFQKGDHQAAMADFRKVLDSNPDDATAGNDLAYELAENTNRLDEALKYSQRAVELAPDRADFADTLGWILYRKGLYASAVPYLERANKDPKNAVARYHLAMAYTKAGNRAHGVTVLQSALTLDPALPEAKAAQDVVNGSH